MMNKFCIIDCDHHLIDARKGDGVRFPFFGMALELIDVLFRKNFGRYRLTKYNGYKEDAGNQQDNSFHGFHGLKIA
jgi:hypothetical protein